MSHSVCYIHTFTPPKILKELLMHTKREEISKYSIPKFPQCFVQTEVMKKFYQHLTFILH
jgi:hypothetical protein